MKKRWIVITAAVLIGVSLFILYLRPDNADPEFTCTPETALASERYSTRWYYKSPFKRSRGVALVVHGLNLKPEKMESIIRRINRAGIDALNVSLHGHGDNYVRNDRGDSKEARLDSFRTVTYSLWSSEVRRAYHKVLERGHRKNVPISLVGYSLGGLLGCDLLVSDAEVHFDRMVLFAPALNSTSEPYLLKALMPFPNLVIDSLSPESYRSNDGTPMAGYKAIFEAFGHFHERINAALNVPTIVFMDREDEFISHDKLQEMIASNRLNRWKVSIVRKTPPEGGLYAHHLLIDEESVGKETWAGMQEMMLDHLLSEPKRP
jgi:alpha-beta hydrolase superfamily lysophospholipase